MVSRALLFCILALPTSFATSVLPERKKKWVKGRPKYSQDSALGCIVSCISTDQDRNLLDQEKQFTLMPNSTSNSSCRNKSVLPQISSMYQKFYFCFSPLQKGQSRRSHKSKRNHKSSLALQNHHGLFQKTFYKKKTFYRRHSKAVCTNDSRCQIYCQHHGGHLAFKIHDLYGNFQTFLPPTSSLLPSQKRKQ